MPQVAAPFLGPRARGTQQLFALGGYFPPSFLKLSSAVSMLYTLFLSLSDFFHKLIINTITTHVKILTFVEFATCQALTSSKQFYMDCPSSLISCYYPCFIDEDMGAIGQS